MRRASAVGLALVYPFVFLWTWGETHCCGSGGIKGKRVICCTRRVHPLAMVRILPAPSVGFFGIDVLHAGGRRVLMLEQLAALCDLPQRMQHVRSTTQVSIDLCAFFTNTCKHAYKECKTSKHPVCKEFWLTWPSWDPPLDPFLPFFMACSSDFAACVFWFCCKSEGVCVWQYANMFQFHRIFGHAIVPGCHTNSCLALQNMQNEAIFLNLVFVSY